MLPLGVAYVASSLGRAGFEPRIVDLSFSIQERLNVDAVAKAVLDHEPDAVGISSFTSTVSSAFRVTEAIKKENGSVPIVLGGPHATALPRETLSECSALDGVIVGEGEQAVQEYLALLHCGTTSRTSTSTKGFVYRNGKELVGTAVPSYIEDLDALPFPARNLFDLKKYAAFSSSLVAKRSPVASIATSRGCPHACVFCARTSGGNRFRSRSPANVVAELEKLEEMGFREFQVVDDDFTHDRQRVLEICRLMGERKLDLSWNLLGGVRADEVDQQLLAAMYSAGCYSIHFGMESGDDSVLKHVGKGITTSQVKDAVHAAKKIGYHVTLYVIIGLPGSTLESEKKTLGLVKEVGSDVTRASICTPYPGSRLWEMEKDNLRGITWERFNESDISNPIYLRTSLQQEQLRLWLDATMGQEHKRLE